MRYNYTYPYSCGLLTFPREEGRHEDANIEWWYFNAHVMGDDGSNYAVMVAYTMSNNMQYMIITDIDNKIRYPLSIKDYRIEYSREKLELSYGVNWWKQLEKPFTYEMHNQHKGMELDLQMKSLKPPMLLGEEGKVTMGKGGYSYWYALTRLDVRGELKLGEEKKHIEVKGTGWIDRQWGNWSWFGFDKWKWFSMQLNNNIELEVFTIYEPFTNRTLTSKFHIMHEDGSSEVSDAFKIIDLSHWKSSTSVIYSMGWKIKAPDRGIELVVMPVFKDQEIFQGLWEGSCKVRGTMNGKDVSGVSYVELRNGFDTQPFKDIPTIKKVFYYIGTALRSKFI